MSQSKPGIAIALATCLAQILTGNPASAASERHFDPSTCKVEAHDMFYIALGRNVLAVPNSGTIMIDPVPEAERLPPPDPAEPEGCAANPQQLSSYAFLYYLEAQLNAKRGIAQATHPGPDRLALYRTVHGDSVPSPDSVQWGGERLQLEEAWQACQNATLREELTNGLTVCRKKTGEEEVHIEDWRAVYTALPEVYTTPFGKAFIIGCNAMSFSYPIGGDCTVAYTVKLGLGLSYSFRRYHGPRAMPIDQVIEFDRSLRAQIEAALVKDYAWPERSPTDHPGSAAKP